MMSAQSIGYMLKSPNYRVYSKKNEGYFLLQFFFVKLISYDDKMLIDHVMCHNRYFIQQSIHFCLKKFQNTIVSQQFIL